ncbi:MAG: GatB/YqeY domain-containing protein [Chlorobi bacterium]|nr:GatB/YqeY domain-containing protein [Chlorobiota bacterium]
MNLKEKINNDLKDAMRAKDKVRLETVRSIRALILEFEKSGKDEEMTSEKEIALLTSAAKKRKESIEQFEKAGRTELAEKEKTELKIIQSYLPKQLSREEIETEVGKLAAEIGATGKKDFPKLMPLAVKTLKGQAGGKEIKEIVEHILSGN